MDVDVSKWSGEGEFTALLLERLRSVATIAAIRVEDAPASRTEADYNFISNEFFVTFTERLRRERFRRFGVLPASKTIVEREMTIAGLDGDSRSRP